MKKDPNRLSGSYESGKAPDYSLPKSKILRGKRNFQRVFETSTVLRSPGIHFRYRIYHDPSEGCFVGFIAKKSLGKAAMRNRLKRVMREVYRTHQHLFTDLFDTGSFGFHSVFLAQKPDLTCEAARDQMIPLMEQARSTLIRRLNLQIQDTVNTNNSKEQA